MHSFGQTFAHSSQPMHLNQSMLCWPQYARGSSTFWYGYRWVTGFRPPGTRRLMPGMVTRVCLIVAIRGRTVPPIVPTLRRRDSASDLGDFIRVLALLHVHQLAFPRADEPALLRADPAAPLRLNLRAQFQEAIDHAEAFHVVPGIRGRGHLDRATHDAKVQGPRRVSFRPVEELADQAALERVQEGTARTALHGRVDVLLDPLHEVFRPEADDVRLFRPLDHPLRTSVPHAAGRSWSTRISGSLLTLRPRMFKTVSPPGFRLISPDENVLPSRLKGWARTTHIGVRDSSPPQEAHHGSSENRTPGFRRPCGSRAFFVARITSYTSAPHTRGSVSARSRPIPCSPEGAPWNRSSTASSKSSRRARILSKSAGSVGSNNGR